MTAREYIRQRATVVNNHLLIGTEEDGPYCVECFESKGEVVNAPFDQKQNGWVCPEGHFGPNDQRSPARPPR